LKRFYLLVMCFSVLFTLSACVETKQKNEKKESASSEVSHQTEKKEENGDSTTNEQEMNKNSELIPSIQNKNMIEMKFGQDFGDEYTQMNIEELPFFDEKVHSFNFHQATLKRPVNWGYQGTLSFSLLPTYGYAATLLTNDRHYAILDEEYLASRGPNLIDSQVLHAATYTSSTLDSVYVKANQQGEKKLDVFTYRLTGSKSMGSLNLYTEDITWLSAEYGLLFLGYYDEKNKYHTKGYKMSDKDWKELDLPQVDSPIVAKGNKGYFVSIKEKAIMSFDIYSGNVVKETNLDSIQGALEVNDFQISKDGSWAISLVDEKGGKIETPNHIFTFKESFNGIDLINGDYLVTSASVVGLIVDTQTGDYTPIATEINDIVATDTSPGDNSGNIYYNTGFSVETINYTIN
jgi:hypothetical protein